MEDDENEITPVDFMEAVYLKPTAEHTVARGNRSCAVSSS